MFAVSAETLASVLIGLAFLVFLGNSGGPVPDEFGGVVGVVRGHLDDRGGGVEIAIDANEVLTLLNELSISTTFTDTPNGESTCQRPSANALLSGRELLHVLRERHD